MCIMFVNMLVSYYAPVNEALFVFKIKDEIIIKRHPKKRAMDK